MKKMTKTELIVELKKKGIKGYSKLKRDEMEELLNKDTSAPVKAKVRLSAKMLPMEQRLADARARTRRSQGDFSHIKDVDVLISGMETIKIADKGMAELQARARVCAEGKNTNLALGQQTIECAPKRVFSEYAARPKPRQAMAASTPKIKYLGGSYDDSHLKKDAYMRSHEHLKVPRGGDEYDMVLSAVLGL